MKLKIKHSLLQKVLRVIQKTVSSKPQLPILSCILLTAKNNSLFLSSTDLFIGIQVEIEAVVEEEGSFAVPSKYFLQLINSLSNSSVEMVTDKTTITISTQGTSSKIVGMNYEDFPSFPDQSVNYFEVSVNEFLSVLSRVVFSTSVDQTRPILTGVLLEPKGASTRLVATDGFRLAIEDVNLEFKNLPKMIVPSKPLLEAFKTAEEDGHKSLQISYSEDQKQLSLVVGSYIFYIRLLDGEYPPYEKIIPSQAQTVATCNREDLKEKLQQSLIFNQDNSFITQFLLQDGEIKLFSSSPSAGESSSTLTNATYSGTDVVIAFNARYILDYLKIVQDDSVQLEIVESLRPAKLAVANHGKHQYIVMPFRVNT